MSGGTEIVDLIPYATALPKKSSCKVTAQAILEI